MKFYDRDTSSLQNNPPQKPKYTKEQIAEHEWLEYQKEVLGREGLSNSYKELRGDF
jgi:hypothetical protein